MPNLVDLKTSLKDLKFGKDQIGGGNSGQPYQTFSIPDDNATPLITDFWENNNTSLDYPIRGGSLVGSGIGSYTLNGQIDKNRIQKFLNDPNRGRNFIEKQVGLQRSNPLMETGNADSSNILSTIQNIIGPIPSLLLGITPNFGGLFNFSGAGGNNQIYNNGKNTLAQVLASGTGVHIERAGKIPVDTNAQYYTDVVGAQLYYNTDEVSQVNRLLLLQSSKLSSNTSGNQYKSIPLNALGLGISPRNLILFDYPGGPGSTYGIGNTTIFRAVNSSEAYDLTQNTNTNASFPNVFTMAYEQIMNAQNNTPQRLSSNGKNRNSTILKDFRNDTGAPTGSQLWYYSQGVDYRFYNNDGVDKMNSANLAALIQNDPFENIVSGSDSDDIIKFGFECMSNDYVGWSTPLFFRAFLTNGINDNNSGEWNSFKYMGRGETFYTYQGFNRSISFGFKVVAFSQQEMKPLYNKLNYLVSQVYPDYSSAGYMRAPIVKLTIGDYLYRVPGVLESVNLTVDNGTPWELTSYSTDNQDVAQLPKIIEVAVSFKPIFDELPRRSVPGSDPKQTIGSAIVGKRGFLNVTTGSLLDPRKPIAQTPGKPGFLENNLVKTPITTPTAFDISNLTLQAQPTSIVPKI